MSVRAQTGIATLVISSPIKISVTRFLIFTRCIVNFPNTSFQDTVHIDQPVALAHIDGDWYESVMTCLQRIEPHLAEGGVMVIDDYDAWSGCRTAVDEYFADKMDRYRFKHQARLHIIRK